DAPVMNLWSIRADGTGTATRLRAGPTAEYPSSWSADGKLLAFTVVSSQTGLDVWMMHTDGTNAAQPLLNSRYNETSAAFSPDARWLAYLSDESGRNEVYIRPVSGPGGKVQISSDGAGEPRWAPSGTELYFRSGAKMMSVPVTTGARFSAGRPTELF